MNPTDRTEEPVRLGLQELFPEPTAVDLLPRVAAHMRRRRRWQRSGLFTAGLATVAAVAAAIMLVVGGGGAGTGSSGDQESYCAAILVWHGHTYAGDGLSSADHPRQVGLVPARRMTSLGQFRQPACGDTGAGSTAAVERIAGVSPQAVVAGSDGTAYLRLGGHSRIPTRRAEAAARRLAAQRWIIWITP